MNHQQKYLKYKRKYLELKGAGKIDWDNNCKIVYSLDTLTKCIATNRKYIGYDIDERGNTFYVYKDEPLGYYISPYTKMKFYKYDIIKVNTKMLKS